MEIRLNLGRNCLRYIIKAYDIKTIYMPYYICPTVISAVRKENCFIKFYHIDKKFMPSEELNTNEYILYPNYFGICAKQTEELSEKYPKLIVDNAHSFYMPHCGIASFKSLRKFFPLKNGAILNINKKLEDNFRTDEYFYESFEKLTYEEMAENEVRLNNQDIKFISPVTEKYFSDIDIEKEKIRRLEKFYEYHNRFKDKNELQFNLSENDVPFIYPYLTHNDFEAENLQKEGLIILRYWSPLPDDFPEYDFFRYLIPIPL